MEARQRLALRAAIRIRETFSRVHRSGHAGYLSEPTWSECQRLNERLQKAQRHGWTLAATRIGQELQSELLQLRAQVDASLRTVDSLGARDEIPMAHQLYDEIIALEHEFEDVRIDFKNRTISVATERILLEDIDLGSFEIRLDWDFLSDGPSYRVIALDPNPAASRSDVVHPHVQDESLCEGDARRSIERTVREARLCDFFTIVTRVLGTYNSSSPYVSLDRWTGFPCRSCGTVMCDDESYSCERCGDTQCEDCLAYCPECDNSVCSHCGSRCDSCGGTICHQCLAPCTACGAELCSSCRDDNDLCEECRDEQADDDTDQTIEEQAAAPNSPTTNAQEAHAPVQSVCLGEAIASA
jgi:hypothetical protein